MGVAARWAGLAGIGVLREQLAEISGDIDHYIAVLAEDLYAASSYLKIVDALRNVGRAADAERWARRWDRQPDRLRQASRHLRELAPAGMSAKITRISSRSGHSSVSGESCGGLCSPNSSFTSS
ncbi:MAG: hypothetical protein ACRDRO_27940 [Pseudonocardiaceae bacterium]